MGEDHVVTPPGVSEHVRAFLVRASDVFAARDADALADLATEDVVFVDHRPLGTEPIVGREASRDWGATMFELLPDWQLRIEVLAHEGDVYLARDSYSSEGGGQFGATDIEWFVVDTLRGGMLAREEIFEDEAEARAAFERTRRAQA